ncbi:hypothetical protein [Microvirga sp. Mcv34]|uniref:hypothetical protein n=1 Tax=Microvirga sp. Mcv34 TaxID=2926016 RepID=UPI0021C8565C|nr:hypothetical protein [Microvirga sp. Mcv34]
MSRLRYISLCAVMGVVCVAIGVAAGLFVIAFFFLGLRAFLSLRTLAILLEFPEMLATTASIVALLVGLFVVLVCGLSVQRDLAEIIEERGAKQ